MKSLVATWSAEVTSVLVSRQTQPPQPMMCGKSFLPLGMPALTPNLNAAKRGSLAGMATYCALGKTPPGSHCSAGEPGGGRSPLQDQM